MEKRNDDETGREKGDKKGTSADIKEGREREKKDRRQEKKGVAETRSETTRYNQMLWHNRLGPGAKIEKKRKKEDEIERERREKDKTQGHGKKTKDKDAHANAKIRGKEDGRASKAAQVKTQHQGQSKAIQWQQGENKTRRGKDEDVGRSHTADFRFFLVYKIKQNKDKDNPHDATKNTRHERRH